MHAYLLQWLYLVPTEIPSLTCWICSPIQHHNPQLSKGLLSLSSLLSLKNCLPKHFQEASHSFLLTSSLCLACIPHCSQVNHMELKRSQRLPIDLCFHSTSFRFLHCVAVWTVNSLKVGTCLFTLCQHWTARRVVLHCTDMGTEGHCLAWPSQEWKGTG